MNLPILYGINNENIRSFDFNAGAKLKDVEGDKGSQSLVIIIISATEHHHKKWLNLIQRFTESSLQFSIINLTNTEWPRTAVDSLEQTPTRFSPQAATVLINFWERSRTFRTRRTINHPSAKLMRCLQATCYICVLRWTGGLLHEQMNQSMCVHITGELSYWFGVSMFHRWATREAKQRQTVPLMRVRPIVLKDRLINSSSSVAALSLLSLGSYSAT